MGFDERWTRGVAAAQPVAPVVLWLRENFYASLGLFVIRLYLGWTWLMAGVHKLSGFDASGYLKGALAKATGDHPDVQWWWARFLEGFAIPNVGLFNFLVPWGEVLVGIGLLLGCFTTAAVFFGAVMNFSFMFSGTVSTNPQMILLSIFLLIAGANAGRIGLDRWIVPYIRDAWAKARRSGKSVPVGN
ncbi:DoxX family protein [Hydrogenibacillus schlegelii]|uniref:Crp/Fnr family transcriptional regulator n=1 Tax=Hydrogenibacillus schlegelii TaxID=1484 RepID=A0A132MGN5_HYDSH|nr:MULTISPECIES: DoxX family protein [Hydrogenibacillus]KWW96925.1 Crp/Fnr family transcriptional regulator [Hydrogenibacillus schlegelii]OAR05480.1 Crp/Fnr family transcriptional regulator [Hydrogenibacillus schlegelii]QZA32287.1 DoxX family protein [Hydrogenibacillus sp. N12]